MTKQEPNHNIDPPQPDPDNPGIRWFNILAEYLAKGNIRLTENPRIINIGCGNRVVWNFFGVCLYLESLGLGLPRYTGVDILPENFAHAKKKLNKMVDFMVADARTLSKQVNGAFDLAVIQHPDISISPEAPKKWRKIFHETYHLLSENGGLVLTTFWLNDHLPAQLALQRAGFTISHSQPNKYPGQQFDTSSKGEPLVMDKYILLATK